MGGNMRLRNKKTGEVFDALIRERGGGDTYSIIVCDIKAYNQSKSTLLATHSILDEYDSLAKLNEDWEDYTPKEPLIKDKKIRKAIRAWYEINFTEKPIYLEDSCTISIDHSPRFEVVKGYYFMTLAKGNPYTITELCGEEEE